MEDSKITLLRNLVEEYTNEVKELEIRLANAKRGLDSAQMLYKSEAGKAFAADPISSAGAPAAASGFRELILESLGENRPMDVSLIVSVMKEKGWVDSAKTKLTTRVNNELARLTRAGEIERVSRGVYKRPRKTDEKSDDDELGLL